MVGLKGDAGEKGDRGSSGPIGPEGIRGEPGAIGVQGLKGNDGPQGPSGELGPLGPKGSEGVAGIKGETGPSGPPGPPGAPADAPLLPPEFLFRLNGDYTKGETTKGDTTTTDSERVRRDIDDAMLAPASDDYYAEGDLDDLMGAVGSKRNKKTSPAKSQTKSKKSQRPSPNAPHDELEPKFLDMYSSIYSMRQEMDRIRKPTGTRANPVRTCRDLHFGHATFGDGYYWIDPNLGMSDDAVYVYCNMTAGGETCISPDIHSAQITQIPWRKEAEAQNDWFANLRGGFRITYESVGSVQMTFLRMLSQEGYQNFTYTCLNSAAWYSAELDSMDMAIKFLGENDAEIGVDSGTLRPAVLTDGCQVSALHRF